MANEKPRFFVEFKPHKEQKLPNKKMSKPLERIEIMNGHYQRHFEAKDAPFAVQDEAELQMLLASGHFVEHQPQAKTAKAKTAKAEGESGTTKEEV